MKPEEFWNHVRKTDADLKDDCWLWTGAKSKNGYGSVRWKFPDGRSHSEYVHRVAYELSTGKPPPKNWIVVRTCGQKLCVKPGHLDVARAGVEREAMSKISEAVEEVKATTKKVIEIKDDALLGALTELRRLERQDIGYRVPPELVEEIRSALRLQPENLTNESDVTSEPEGEQSRS